MDKEYHKKKDNKMFIDKVGIKKIQISEVI